MSDRAIKTCDVCGKDRAEVNGWWAYWTDKAGNFIANHSANRKGKKHACGRLCLHKAMDAHFDVVRPVEALGDATLPAEGPQGQAEALCAAAEASKRPVGLTVAGLVAEQGGNPAEAVYEPHPGLGPEVEIDELEKML